MNSEYSLLDIIKVMQSHWKKIAGLVFIAGLLSAGAALLLPTYYQATTSFYPASQDLVKPSKIFGGGDKELNFYGTREDLDRILTIGDSRQVFEDLIKEFDLYTRYEIDSLNEKAQSKVGRRLQKLYTLMRTDRDAIELKVEDEDPQVAANMANFARDRIAHITSEMVRNSQKGMITKMEDNVRNKSKLVKELSDSLKYIQTKYNIYNSAAQSEYLSTEVAMTESSLAENRGKIQFLKSQPYVQSDSIVKIESKIRGYEKKLKSMLTKNGGLFNLESFRDGRPLYNEMNDIYTKELNQLNYNKLLLSQFELTSKSDLPTLHLIESAEPPNIKSRPRRSILVLGAMFLTFLLSVLVILLGEFWRKLNH